MGDGGIFIYIFGQNTIAVYITEDFFEEDELYFNMIAGYPKKIAIAFTINGTIFKLYINGILRSTSSPQTAGNVNFQNLIELGYSSSYGATPTILGTKFYNSLIYNRALNDNEILQNHNALKGRFNL